MLSWPEPRAQNLLMSCLWVFLCYELVKVRTHLSFLALIQCLETKGGKWCQQETNWEGGREGGGGKAGIITTFCALMKSLSRPTFF